ncbi:MAG TPA: TIGR00730 family Rossman fold protein [Lacipirellulaceae bacterium]|nr:TIGR00730 family Rossman fold protein [Lacipirellulaceae bacterium]
MSDNGDIRPANPDGAAPKKNSTQLVDLIRRLRHAADRLPVSRTAHEDVRILSQTLRELRRAFTVFAPYRSQRKATIFGSARTPRDAPAYQQTVRLGQLLVQNGWFVVTGAATGIMEAGHRGAGRDRSMGLNIMLPFEQEANEVIRGDGKLVTMKYFFTRKLMFVKECDAVVCLPGGFGTMDEAFEVLTLLQTGKRELMPLVFLDAPGGRFWQNWLDYIRGNLLEGGMISPDDLSLFRVTDSVDEAIADILRFYRVFHSMEYIQNRLVLRLQQPIDAPHMNSLRQEFTDILTDGDFRQGGAIAGESPRPELAALSRLTFHFNRRSLGRLRQLIDAINRGDSVPCAA